MKETFKNKWNEIKATTKAKGIKNTMSDYMDSIHDDESGMEMMAVIIIIAICVVLAGIVIGIVATLNKHTDNINNNLEDNLNDIEAVK